MTGPSSGACGNGNALSIADIDNGQSTNRTSSMCPSAGNVSSNTRTPDVDTPSGLSTFMPKVLVSDMKSVAKRSCLQHTAMVRPLFEAAAACWIASASFGEILPVVPQLTMLETSRTRAAPWVVTAAQASRRVSGMSNTSTDSRDKPPGDGADLTTYGRICSYARCCGAVG